MTTNPRKRQRIARIEAAPPSTIAEAATSIAEHAYCLVLAANPYPRVCVAPLGDGKPLARKTRSTVDRDGYRIEHPAPPRWTVETFDPHGSGGIYYAPAGAVKLLDATPRTWHEATEIARLCPAPLDHRLAYGDSAVSAVQQAIRLIHRKGA